MGLLTFKGGVHPNDGKSLAKDKAIVELLPQGDLVYPLSQHIGAPAKPVVAKGDHVLKGQKIAEAGGFVSAPIYASVSGTVKAIEPRVNPTGSKVNSIIIANDGQYEEVEYPQPKPLSELTKEEILNIIGEAGVVGMGGAGFPTRVKLSPKEPDKIDYIIDYKLKIIILCNYICLTHLKLRQIKNIIYNTKQCLSRIFYVRSIL
mgnify:CR=1 FL=1